MEFDDFKGMTFISVERDGNDGINFITDTGRMYNLSSSDGPPNDVEVFVESIVGDLDDLLNTPILKAEVASNDDEDLDPQYTWTFYKLATIKGYVDIRFCGRSNGYYSEKADVHDYGNVDISHIAKRSESAFQPKKRFDL